MKRLIHKPTINLGHNNPPVNLKSIDFTNSAIEKFKLSQFNELDYPNKPKWPLDEDAVFLKGAGVKL